MPMAEILKVNAKLQKSRAQFNNELKMYINQKLYEKRIISEDMYFMAKELLVKQTC